jgi:2-dehydropantoate 2-reductase
MRIAIAGAGGTGGYFGGLLARAGNDVIFLARGTQLAALQAHGLTVKSRLAGDFCLPVTATDDVSGLAPVDLVLFCVKTYDTDTAAERIRPIVGPETMLLSLQNGVDNEERLGRIFGERAVLGAVAYVVSAIAAPGVIEQTAGPGKIVFGELTGGTSPRAERLLQVFQAAGIAAELRTDVQVAIWEKFLFICAYSGITALTRLPIGPVLDCPESLELFQGLLREVEVVARAAGVALPAGCSDQALVTARGMGPGGRSSLYFDLAAGHRMELEALNGVIVRLSRQYGVPAPLNFAVYAALKPYADGQPAS